MYTSSHDELLHDIVDEAGHLFGVWFISELQDFFAVGKKHTGTTLKSLFCHRRGARGERAWCVHECVCARVCMRTCACVCARETSKIFYYKVMDGDEQRYSHMIKKHLERRSKTFTAGFIFKNHIYITQGSPSTSAPPPPRTSNDVINAAQQYEVSCVVM